MELGTKVQVKINLIGMQRRMNLSILTENNNYKGLASEPILSYLKCWLMIQ
jgi:hypothetical protein